MVPFELREAEEVPGDGDDGGVEFPAMDGYVRVEMEERAGGGARAEAEDGEGWAREERREGGEDVEVGGSEGAVGATREGDGVDVARAVEEEEARAGEGVAGSARGDVGDADVVVRGADVGDELELVGEGLGNGGSCRGGADGGEVETVQTEDGSRDRKSVV